jgi:DNA-binding PadR family transcriptional regulator
MAKTSPPAVRQFLPLSPILFHILVALADQDRHGYGILQDVLSRTQGRMRLSPGTLYGSIKRMLEEGWIEETGDRPDPEEDDDRRRYYRLTKLGRAVGEAEMARLREVLRQATASGLLPGRA